MTKFFLLCSINFFINNPVVFESDNSAFCSFRITDVHKSKYRNGTHSASYSSAAYTQQIVLHVRF